MSQPQQHPQPVSAAEIELRARQSGEIEALKWTLHNEGCARFQALGEKHAAERVALRAAEKSGAPLAPATTPPPRARGRRRA